MEILSWSKSSFRFFHTIHGKTQKNFLANPTHKIFRRSEQSSTAHTQSFMQKVAGLTKIRSTFKDAVTEVQVNQTDKESKVRINTGVSSTATTCGSAMSY